MQVLTAQTSILFESKMYKQGEELPVKNPVMVEAWLAAGTAVLIDNEQTEAPKTPKAPKARPRTAEPGLPGVAVHSESENGENLVGKVPKTNSRKKK